MHDKTSKLSRTNAQVQKGIKKINGDEKNKNNCNELPNGYGQHSIKNTKAMPKWAALFTQIKCAVAIDKTPSINNAGVAEPGVLVGF